MSGGRNGAGRAALRFSQSRTHDVVGHLLREPYRNLGSPMTVEPVEPVPGLATSRDFIEKPFDGVRLA
jgi:hypothetical protein